MTRIVLRVLPSCLTVSANSALFTHANCDGITGAMVIRFILTKFLYRSMENCITFGEPWIKTAKLSMSTSNKKGMEL
jgi:hypothetical protein